VARRAGRNAAAIVMNATEAIATEIANDNLEEKPFHLGCQPKMWIDSSLNPG
jgi:hypothetical protein